MIMIVKLNSLYDIGDIVLFNAYNHYIHDYDDEFKNIKKTCLGIITSIRYCDSSIPINKDLNLSGFAYNILSIHDNSIYNDVSENFVFKKIDENTLIEFINKSKELKATIVEDSSKKSKNKKERDINDKN